MEENGAHFFEGTEKLLEVWFSRQDETKGTGDLRTIPRLVCFSVCSINGRDECDMSFKVRPLAC